jgi:serine/threonine protein kinase
VRVLELGYEDYRSLLEPIEALLERVQNPEPEPLAFLTNYFAERKDWRRVLRLADMTLRAQPGLTNISQRMMQACEQILLQDPDASDVRLRLADLHLERNNIERAMQEYRRAAAVPEYSMKAKRRLAFALMKAGDSTGALEQFKSLAVLDPEDIEHLYDLLIRLSAAELFKEAIEAAQLILEYDKKFRDVATKLGELEGKLEALGEAFAIDPKMRELIGEHAIGRYKYLGKVGSGGMGVVHRVLDLKNDQTLAMKILREGLSGSGRALDRFFREARIASTLRHRNIVRIVDYNISNNPGQSYIAMEFIDGPSLRDVIERKFTESMDLTHAYILQALDWMSQLCDALDCTHKKGIIHRDIKPDNILIAPGDIVKVTDFGIVHVEEATFTPTGALIGTPRYMSPEQVHGGRIDGRSDIYSVGIIFYETLIGSPPFISGDIAYQQVNVLPTRPIEITQQIPAQIDRIIMKCLEKNANDRYQEALELKAAIDETFIRMGGDPDRRRPSSTSADITRESIPRMAIPPAPPIAAQLPPAGTTASLSASGLPVRSPIDRMFSEQATDASEDQRRTDTQRKLDISPLDGDLD